MMGESEVTIHIGMYFWGIEGKGDEMRKNLREARQRAGLTQKEVAEYLGMTERAYQRIESGERIGMIKVWDLLEDLFKIHQRVLREFSSN